MGAGCKPAKPKAPAVAAAPIPTAAAEPLSAPQTTARLPPPQPIPPGAIPSEPERPAEAAKPSPPPETPAPSKPAPTARPPASAPAPAANPPRLRPLFSAEQERDLQRQIEGSLTVAERAVAQSQPSPGDKERLGAVERVRAFITQARQAREEGDLNRARSLAQRAEWLAADLAKGSR